MEERIRTAFSYAFSADSERLPAGYVPKLVFQRITTDPFIVLEQMIVPVPLVHAGFNVFGFRIDDVAYCTDVSRIPEGSWPRLEGLRVLVLDALRFKPHPAHFGLHEALAVIERLKPARAYLTHMSHDLDHEKVSRQLPANVQLAYDGLTFEF